MSLKRFAQIGDTGIYERGDDTCAHPRVTIHAPRDRVAAADKWLVRVTNPTQRAYLPMGQRGTTYAANSYRAAVKIANSFKF